jgi:hypothetical protein
LEKSIAMKTFFSALLLILTIHPISAQTAPTLQDTIAAYFAQVKAATRKAEKLWDKDIYGPVLLVNPLTRQAYANFPDTAGILKPEGEIYAGLLPAKVPLGNASVNWSGRMWAMVLILPGTLQTERSDLIGLFAHELFHVAQPSVGFPRTNDQDNNHLDRREGRIFLRLELAALLKAVRATTARDRKTRLTDAYIFRKYRHSLFPGADTTENWLERHEGITEYTGVIISDRSKKDAIAHFDRKTSRFLTNPTYVRTFAYYTTPIYGYLLRRSDKYWNKKITANTNLTGFFQQAFKLDLPADLPAAAAAAGGKYGMEAIMAEEANREETRKKLVAEYKARFLNQPVFEIEFKKKSISFNSGTLLPIEDLGTVYPTMTAIDLWGTLTVESGGGLMSPDRDKVTLSVPLQINDRQVSGDGWKLQLNEGYSVVKDDGSGNYKLIKN